MHQYEPKSRLCNVIPIGYRPHASKDEAITGQVMLRQSCIARTVGLALIHRPGEASKPNSSLTWVKPC